MLVGLVCHQKTLGDKVSMFVKPLIRHGTYDDIIRTSKTHQREKKGDEKASQTAASMET